MAGDDAKNTSTAASQQRVTHAHGATGDANNIAAQAEALAKEGAYYPKALEYKPSKPLFYFNIWKGMAAALLALAVLSSTFRSYAGMALVTFVTLIWAYHVFFCVLPFRGRNIAGPFPWTPAGSLFALGIVPSFGLHKLFGWEGGYQTFGGNSLCEGLDAFFHLYGDAYQVWLGFDRVIIFNTEESAKYIYGQNRSTYDQAAYLRDRQKGIASISLSTSAGETHRRHIRALGPMLKRWKLIPFIPNITIQTNKLMDRFADDIKKGRTEEFKMIPIYYKLLLLDIFGALAFDHNLDSLSHNTIQQIKKNNKLGWAILVVIETVAFKFVSGVPGFVGLWLERFDLQLSQARYVIKSYLKTAIEKSILKPSEAPANLLDLLVSSVEGEKPILSVDELFDDLTLFLFAGSDSSSSMLGFATYWLSKSPEIQKALREEVWSVLGKPTKAGDWRNDAPITHEHLEDMTLLDNVVQETLRISSTSLGASREAFIDDVIDGYAIKKGDNLLFNAVQIQHDPRYYERPNEFLPQRWAENPELQLHTFGGGHRICVGKDLARLELKVILAKILRYASFQDTGPLNSLSRIAGNEQWFFHIQIAVPDVRNLRVKVIFDEIEAAAAAPTASA